MNPPLLELDGTAEEIQKRLADFAGQRLHVTIRPLDAGTEPTLEELLPKLSITEKLLAMAEEIPLEERAQMPPDLADQHNHYIYGWPKK